MTMQSTEVVGSGEYRAHLDHAEEIKPTITPTLVIGLGGTGTTAVRYLKRRLVWLWHRKEIEKDLERCPENVDPMVWHDEIWRRYEVAGGPPSIQLLAVDTIPWMNRAGQVYLCRHEYAFLGGYNATKVLEAMREHEDRHQEIREWWGWATSRPGQIHSGAKQIRAIGRLSLYRRYRELWSKLRPKIERIASIEARQVTEDHGHPVAPAKATKRVYIITSICGGTGAGTYLDVTARLRAHYGEAAFITGIFALPSVFTPELQSDLQHDRIQANAYAALKEINYFQSHAYESWLPGEARERVEPLFDRLYLVERQNKAGESLNSVNDVCQLIADQVFLESMTDVGSRMWEYDANVTMERRKKEGRAVSYVFSSFANSSLLVPRDQMLSFCELKYATELIAGLTRELTPDERNDLNRDAAAALDRVEELVRTVAEQAARAGAAGAIEEAPISDEELATGEPQETPRPGATGPLEQLTQEVNRAIQGYGLRGGLYLAEALAKSLREQVERCREEQSQQEASVGRLEDERRQLQTSRPWYLHWDWFVLRPFTRAPRQTHENALASLQANLASASGRIDLLRAQRAEWSRLQSILDPLIGQIEARLRLLARIRSERFEPEIGHLFESPRVGEHQPYEMFRMVLTEEYISKTMWPEVEQEGLAPRRDNDVRALLQTPNDPEVPRICEVRVVTSSIARAGTTEYLSTLEVAPANLHSLSLRIRRVAREAVTQFVKDEQLHIRRFLEEPRFAIQSRLRDFFERCEPFWRYSLDQGGLSERDLEQVSLVGVRNAGDPAWEYLLRDFTGDFALVDTDDPSRIDACRIEHGLPVEFLQALPELKRKYDQSFQEDAGPLQLDARWEPDGPQALPELIGEPPKRERTRPGAGDTGVGADSTAGATQGTSPSDNQPEGTTAAAGGAPRFAGGGSAPSEWVAEAEEEVHAEQPPVAESASAEEQPGDGEPGDPYAGVFASEEEVF